jgi:hypothetical protein
MPLISLAEQEGKGRRGKWGHGGGVIRRIAK